MAKYDPYATGLSIGQMLAHAKGREDKHSVGFARTGQPAPSPEQELMAAIEAKIFGSQFNNVGAPQRDPRVGQPMRMPLRSDSDYADPVRAIRERRRLENTNDGSEAWDAAWTEAGRLEDIIPESDDPALGGAPLGEKEAYAYFDRRDAKVPAVSGRAELPVQAIARQIASQPTRQSSIMSTSPSSGRGGSPYFEAGPSSQDGLDMASALLQQRLGAMGQNQNMDLMYRRDPRAATALIQAQMAAQEEAANRAQRGDIANQEMGYRNRSLDMQGELAGADRQASMDRLLASLAARRGETTDQMSHAQRLQEAAQIAATQEAARQREHQTGLAGRQMEFQSGENRLGRQHSTESESRRAMLETMLKGMEISGLDKRSQDDMRTKMMAAYANLAESAADPNYPAAKAALDSAFAGMNAQMTGAPPPKPQEPATAEGRFAAKYPELKASWDAASMGKDGATKKSMADFLKSIAIEDIRNQRDPLKAYLGLRYQGESPDSELSNSWSINPNTTAKTDAVRQAMGLEPTGNWWQDARKIGFNPLMPGADATGAAMEWLSKLVK